jgi:hypothetical protein
MTLYWLFVMLVALTPTFMDLNKLRYNRGLPLYRSQGEIFDNALMIVNTAFGFEYPLPISPLIKMTGIHWSFATQFTNDTTVDGL